MFFSLRCFQDMHPVILCFATRQDAQCFKKFADAYYDDSGAGNGYTAYWIYPRTRIKRHFWTPRKAVASLDDKMLAAMLYRLFQTRKAVNSPAVIDIRMKIGEDRGAITFFMDELPSRQRPTAGDMYRMPRSKILDDNDFEFSEGRVVEDLGKTLKVGSCSQFKGKNPKPGRLKTIEISADRAIKINDWLSEMCPSTN